MTAHKNAGGIAVHWLIFGSSGHITKPEGGVLENYTKCAEDNFSTNGTIKTICDPMKVLSFCHVHFPIYLRGFLNLDENGTPLTTSYTKKIHFKNIRINHYVTKSKEEYIVKQNRGRADTGGKWSMSYFDSQDRNEFTDTEILSRI